MNVRALFGDLSFHLPPDRGRRKSDGEGGGAPPEPRIIITRIRQIAMPVIVRKVHIISGIIDANC